MTPREFQRECEAMTARPKDAQSSRAHGGQTHSEQRHALEVLSERYKIPLKTRVK